MFGIEFLVRGARDFGEPGVLLAFEEAQDDLVTNVASLGFDLEQLERDGLLAIDAFRLDPAEIVETGSFDLEGLFIRLQMAVESVGAKRVVLDTIEVLFSALPERGHRPRRARPPVPLAQGARPHRRDHRRARQAGQPDAVRHRGVRLGLRGHPGPPGHRRDLHAAAARGEVPRVAARHQRVPLPDHRPGPGGRADHLGRPDLRGLDGARVQRHPAARRDAARAASTAGRR